jgi:hypothetical protein
MKRYKAVCVPPWPARVAPLTITHLCVSPQTIFLSLLHLQFVYWEIRTRALETNMAFGKLITFVCLAHVFSYLSLPAAAALDSHSSFPLHGREHSRAARRAKLAAGVTPSKDGTLESFNPVLSDDLENVVDEFEMSLADDSLLLGRAPAEPQADSLPTIRSRRIQAIIDNLNKEDKAISDWCVSSLLFHEQST